MEWVSFPPLDWLQQFHILLLLGSFTSSCFLCATEGPELHFKTWFKFPKSLLEQNIVWNFILSMNWVLGSSSEINPLFKLAGILSQTSKEAWGVWRQEQAESMECKQSKAKLYQFEGDDRAWAGCCLNSPSGIPPGEAVPSLLGTGMKQSLSGCSLNPTIKECKLFYTSDMKVFASWRIEPWHRKLMGILQACCKALKKFFIQQEFVLNSDGPHWK